jgi:hypothetical protein
MVRDLSAERLKVVSQRAAEIAGQIRHSVERLGSAGNHPAAELASAHRRFPMV